jgi:hypothetical protein
MVKRLRLGVRNVLGMRFQTKLGKLYTNTPDMAAEPCHP